jgi:hypothetical protein
LASSLLDRLTSSMTLLEVEEKAVLQAWQALGLEKYHPLTPNPTFA